MDIITILATFALFAMIVTIATDRTAQLFEPFVNIDKYKLLVAFVWTSVGIVGLNVGMLETLEIITGVAYSWIHVFDLALTSVFLTGGAQGIHRLADMFMDYIGKKTQ